MIGTDWRTRKDTSFMASQLAATYRQVERTREGEAGTENTTMTLTTLRELINRPRSSQSDAIAVFGRELGCRTIQLNQQPNVPAV